MPFTPDQTPKSDSATPGFTPDQSVSEAQHSTPEQTVKTFLESAIPGAKAFESVEPGNITPILNRLGPLGRVASVIKDRMGAVNPEDIRAREQANPIASTAGNIASLLVPGGEGALLEKAGSKVLAGAEKLAPSIAEKGILKGMTRGAIKVAAENALYQGGDESTKMILKDPNQTLGSAVANIGLAGALGAVAGGAIGAVNPLWKAASETKVGQLISDFKVRMQEHLGVPEVPSVVSEESAIPLKPKPSIDPFTKESYSPKTPENTAETYQDKGQKFDPFTKQVMDTPKTQAPIISQSQPIQSAESAGSKLADALVKNSDNIMSKGLAGAVGGAVGHMTGIPMGGAIGALIGERALAPLLKSILPAIGKSILERDANPEGFKSAIEYTMNAIKGQKLANSTVKAVFSPGSYVLPENKRPTPELRKKLDTAIQAYQSDMTKMANIGGNVGHYLPQHAQTIGMVTTNAVNFLNSIRPQPVQRAPLDPPLKPSQAVQAQYDRVLDIAQQPLTVLQSVKDGTLTSNDVKALHSLYPDLYASLRDKMMSEVIDIHSKGDTVPYQIRLGMGMFLQQPLDSTMKPMAIALAQPSQQQQQPEMGSSAQKPQKVSQGASSNLIKGSKASQTASQASEAMHSTQKA